MLPCKQCPLIPICRHKDYHSLLLNCTTLFEMLYDVQILEVRFRTQNFGSTITELTELMKPTKWRYTLGSCGEILPIREYDRDSL